MSISQEIQRIKTNIANAYTQANAKGATLPEQQNSANLASTISSISGGGGLNIQHGINPTKVNVDGYVTEVQLLGFDTVPNNAFSNTVINEKLEKIELDENITKIGNSAFLNCTKLKEIIIPENVSEIGDQTFYNCKSLKKIDIPKNIASIPNYAIYNCDSLEEININNDNSFGFGSYAIYNCAKLKRINITGVVGNFNEDKNNFKNCPELEEINIDNDINKSVGNKYQLKNGAITYYGNTTCLYPQGKKDETHTIPTVFIREYAYQGCTYLKNIILESTNSIVRNAFKNCTKLEKVIIKYTTSNVTLQANNSFVGTKIESGEGFIYVPDAKINWYKSATNWSAFADQIKPLSELEE